MLSKCTIYLSIDSRVVGHYSTIYDLRKVNQEVPANRYLEHAAPIQAKGQGPPKVFITC